MSHLTYWADRRPNATAVVLAGVSARASITYADLDARSSVLAGAAVQRGWQPRDVVVVAVRNSIELFVVHWACMKAGLDYVPLSPKLRAAEYSHVLAQQRPKLLVADRESAEALDVAARDSDADLRVCIDGAVGPFRALDDLEDGRPLPREGWWEGRLVFYSSGTTGRQKAIVRDVPLARPGEIGTHGVDLAEGFGLQEGDRFLSPGPLYHAAPLAFSTTQHRIGATAIVMDRFEAERALALFANESVTTSQWVPTMFSRMLPFQDAWPQSDFRSHRLALHAAAPCPIATKRQMIEWWGPILTEYYGGSEGGRTMITTPEWLQHPGSVGRHWRGGNVYILDNAGRLVAPIEQGRIFFDAPETGRFRYLDDPEATARAYDGDRFTLGDIGYLDEDGYLFLTDRASDLVISGGVNIYPRESENILLAHSQVRDAAVFGIPDEDLGEVLVAVVVQAESATLTAEELLRYCRGKVAIAKCPRRIVFVDSLPRSDAGKVSKLDLRTKWPDLVAAELAHPLRESS